MCVCDTGTHMSSDVRRSSPRLITATPEDITSPVEEVSIRQLSSGNRILFLNGCRSNCLSVNVFKIYN